MIESVDRSESLVDTDFTALLHAIPVPLREASKALQLKGTSRVEVLTTGDELIEGAWRDLHSQAIARTIMETGGQVSRFNTVGDQIEALTGILNEITERAEVCILTGGLGPTVDDLTIEALSLVAGVEAPIIESCWLDIMKRFPQLKNAESSNRRQARLPYGGLQLCNMVGTAPAIYIKLKECHVFAFPGPPQELSWFIDHYLKPWFSYLLREIQQTHCQRVLRVALVGESLIAQRVQSLTLPVDVKVGYQALGNEHRIKVKASTFDSLEKACRAIEKVADRYYLNDTDRSLAEEVIECAQVLGLTIGFAESCTGGQVSAAITAVSGSSSIFSGGIVSYSNAVKERVLNVPSEVLKEHGAVSEPCAKAMAIGARKALQVDWSVSITGIAGPNGGSEDKPVGTVCFAWSSEGTLVAKRMQFKGNRDRIQNRSVAYALFTLLKIMKGELPNDEQV